jgi:hypothetical protein
MRILTDDCRTSRPQGRAACMQPTEPFMTDDAFKVFNLRNADVRPPYDEGAA